MDEITGPVLAISSSRLGLHSLLSSRHQRPVLPAIRGDDRRVDDHLGDQRPDMTPFPGGPHFKSEELADAAVTGARGHPARSTSTRRNAAVVFSASRGLAAL